MKCLYDKIEDCDECCFMYVCDALGTYRQTRSEAIDEYSSKLFEAIERATVSCRFNFDLDDLHGLEILIKGLAEEMKEN